MNAPVKTNVENQPPFLSEDEIAAVRAKGAAANMLPSRCYHSEEIYQYEVEKIFRRNWLVVGRWDQVENPGDYFTVRLFGEPIVVVRDLQGELHALINVCQHRWTQVVEGEGNVRLFICPYHRWTYALDGGLRGVAGAPMEDFNERDCRLPSLQVEIWQGFVFVNFDPAAAPLAPQLEPISRILDRRRLSEYRFAGSCEYDAPWNWKFSIENGGEAYHHIGIHHDRINHIVPGATTHVGNCGGVYFTYHAPGAPGSEQHHLILGRPPHMNDDEYENILQTRAVYVAVFPNLIFYCRWEHSGYIVFEHNSAARNKATTILTLAPHVLEHPEYEAFKERAIAEMQAIQEEDSLVCRRMQQGVTSSYNKNRPWHPLERGQLSHFHNWLVDQYLAGTKT